MLAIEKPPREFPKRLSDPSRLSPEYRSVPSLFESVIYNFSSRQQENDFEATSVPSLSFSAGISSTANAFTNTATRSIRPCWTM